jgi:bifunctional DNase/RNase
VEVHELRDTTFYARLILSGREYSEAMPLKLDARPSDAFALAVRRKCPVFLAQKIINKVGVPVEIIIDEAAGKGKRRWNSDQGGVPEQTSIFGINARRDALLAELEGAIAAEEYERAAEIRDILLQMDREFKKDDPPS